MKRQTVLLWVKAVEHSDVREIDEHGRPLNSGICRFVGKSYDAVNDKFNVIEAGVEILYHSLYINRIKEKALLPMDLKTATLAGVNWNPGNL